MGFHGYGISVPARVKTTHNRLITPGLQPTKVLGQILLGMSRPEWVKFIVSSVISRKLDLDNEDDLLKLVYDTKLGYLKQALHWSRQGWKDDEYGGGYGIGFFQLKQPGSIGIFPNITAKRFFEDELNSLHANFNRSQSANLAKSLLKHVDQDARPSLDKVAKRLSEMRSLDEEGLEQFGAWFVQSCIAVKFPDPEERAKLFTIFRQFISVVRSMDAAKWTSLASSNESRSTALTKPKSLLTALVSGQPGRQPKGLEPHEIACILHEFARYEAVRPVFLSCVLYYVLRRTSGSADYTGDPDDILVNSLVKLKEAEVRSAVSALYDKITDELSGYTEPRYLLSRAEFMEVASFEKIQEQACWWEFNLVTASLEELVRDICSSPSPAPYGKTFDEGFDGVNKDFAKWVVGNFIRFSRDVGSIDTYTVAYGSDSDQIIEWSNSASTGLSRGGTLRHNCQSLLANASQISDVLSYSGDRIRVEAEVSDVNPMIAKPSLYEWFEAAVDSWLL